MSSTHHTTSQSWLTFSLIMPSTALLALEMVCHFILLWLRQVYFCIAAVAMFALKVYDYVTRKLTALFEHYPDLNWNFNHSIFPAATFNFGPKCVCRCHTDHGNAAYFWCPITALGNNDPTKGGHLILFDLQLIIEFPPGSTILIPSGILCHGNTPIQDHKTCMSFTQYSAG